MPAPPAVVSANDTFDERAARSTIIVASLGTFLVLATYTTPMGALDATFSALSADVAGRAWIMSAMSIGLSATLLTAGALADSFGRRRVFVVGAIVLAAGSALAALSSSTWPFVVARIVQGVGGAALTASSLGVLGHTFTTPAARTRATAIWGASLGAGIGIGPLVAALFDRTSGWHGAHWFCAVLAVVIAWYAQTALAESRAASRRAVDVVGTLLLVTAVGSLLAGLVLARSADTAVAAGVVVVGVVGLVAFVLSQRKAAAMVPLSLFRRADFVAANVGAAAAGLGVITVMAYVPVVLGRGLGVSSLLSASFMLVWSGTSVVVSSAARGLPETFTPRWRLVSSLVVVAVGGLAVGGLDVDSAPWRLLPGLIVAGVGTGVLNATLGRQAVASVPAGSAAMGSGANNTARYVGAAFGFTIAALVLGSGAGADAVASWNVVVVVTSLCSIVGAVIVACCAWPERA